MRTLLPDFWGLTLLQIVSYRNTEPAKPNDTRNHSICYLASGRVVGELEAQASLNDGEGQNGTAPPDMKVRPDRSLLCSNEGPMVKRTEDGLEDESDDDSDTDDGVVFVDL